MPSTARGWTTRIGITSLGLAVMLILAGCGSSFDKPALAKVTGKVSYKGKPVEAGRVVFTPTSGGESGQTASSEIASDGTYNLSTFEDNDGAILGEHIVTVTVTDKDFKSPQPKPDGTIDYTMPKGQAPKKYAVVETSPLRCSVKEGGVTFDIELTD